MTPGPAPDLTPGIALVIAIALVLGAAACLILAAAQTWQLAGRARRAWDRGKAVHDRIDVSRAERKAVRRIRRRFPWETAPAEHDQETAP